MRISYDANGIRLCTRYRIILYTSYIILLLYDMRARVPQNLDAAVNRVYYSYYIQGVTKIPDGRTYDENCLNYMISK